MPLSVREFGKAAANVSATAAGGQTIVLLECFMRYIAATFFHHPRGGSSAAAVGCTVRVYRGTAQIRGAASSALLRHLAVRRWKDAHASLLASRARRREFHDYFVTHLPSSSVHADSRPIRAHHHKLPRSASTPHTPGPGSSPAVAPPGFPIRGLTVVRIPLRSAKHHFGAFQSRGSRKYNEDTSQAGTIDMPAFAKRAPISLVRGPPSKPSDEGTCADSTFGDPQSFYFAVFDGHGGSECSEFLRDELHGYIEEAAGDLGLGSTLRPKKAGGSGGRPVPGVTPSPQAKKKALELVDLRSPDEIKPELKAGEKGAEVARMPRIESSSPAPVPQQNKGYAAAAVQLMTELVREYRTTIGGYFRRFHPVHFDIPSPWSASNDGKTEESGPPCPATTVEAVLEYAFLRADLDFVTAQARKPDPDDPRVSDFPLNHNEVLGSPHLPPSGHGIGGPTRFKGGSTASIALISTPTPAPFWHPAAHSSLLVAHVGDTRVLLCETATGLARPLTDDHRPSSPTESRRLRRFATTSLVTDSFGEERIAGLANSRAFGDMKSKRIGVSAEPEITRVDMGPAEYSFLVLMTDGVSGTLSDQEIVDVIKEAPTPEDGSRRVVEYATEISSDGDNATCLVVRLGGWERRSEGGLGSMGTKEIRDVRRAEALDPRRGRR